MPAALGAENMAGTGRPLVAIVGGLWTIDQTKRAAAKEQAKLIGAELAKSGFGLVTYFSNDDSLEPHVVSGYVEASPQDGIILVRYAESQIGEVKFAEEATRRELFEYNLFPGSDWEAPFYQSLVEDRIAGVLLLGGHTSTLIAGQIALARRLPMIVINTFGGSAAKVWGQLKSTADPELRSWSERDPPFFAKRLKEQCDAIADQRARLREREATIARLGSRTTQITYFAVSFIAVLAMVATAMVTKDIMMFRAAVFGGLIAGGATGAAARPLLSSTDQTEPLRSALLGALAGLVVGVAYLLPQLVGAPGVFAIGARALEDSDLIRFFSVLLLALAAGLGFDTVLDRLRKTSSNLSVDGKLGTKP
jgi:hypothetical protein